jgi:hypothetical protein
MDHGDGPFMDHFEWEKVNMPLNMHVPHFTLSSLYEQKKKKVGDGPFP